ncbi:MAG: M23 family metallopeptidase [Pseudomonadota bacterium]
MRLFVVLSIVAFSLQAFAQETEENCQEQSVEINSSVNTGMDLEIDAATDLGIKKEISVIYPDIKIIYPLVTMCKITKNGDFGPRKLNGQYDDHNGIDFPVWCGTKVIAAHSGTIAKAGEDEWNGKYVVLDSEDRTYQTVYIHLSKIPKENLVIGKHLNQGDAIGWTGTTGICYGSHLHFTLYLLSNDGKTRKAIDPMLFFIDYPPKECEPSTAANSSTIPAQR